MSGAELVGIDQLLAMQCIVATTALLALLAVGSQLGTAQGQSSPQLLLQGRFYPGPDSSGYGTLPQTIS